MSEEQVSIQVTRYRDKAGQPTCAIDFETGKVCQFYRTRKYGTVEFCALAAGVPVLIRRQGSLTLEPAVDCPIWRGHRGKA